ncbi:MAG: hypothetical protein FGM41_11515, partial [Bacteroidetes bacterium]|nr:hypothetical protein [Bacteroidota bacterium]
MNSLGAQPGTKVKELFRDRYTIPNGIYGHPYSIFDKHNQNDFQLTIFEIRKRIKIESPDSILGPIFLAYQKVYNNAIEPRPTDDGMPNTGISGLARWAKSNAFVMLVGLNGNGDSLSLAARDSCKNRVLEAFENMTG